MKKGRIGTFLLATLVSLILLSLMLVTTYGADPLIHDGSAENWPIFHHDSQHSGVISGIGDINGQTGPLVHWRYQVAVISSEALSSTRWTSTFPLGDLDGDGTLEVVVTSPGILGVEENYVMALKDAPGDSPPVIRKWLITETVPLDMYSPALADANNDSLLDVIYVTGNGQVKAVEGQNKELIWEYNAGRSTEAGPTVGDLDNDGQEELILVTDCDPVGTTRCPDQDKQARLVVLPIQAHGINSPTWSLDYPAKLDSAVPALADIDAHPNQDRLAIVAGTWDGNLLVAWRRPDGQVISDTFPLADLDPLAEGDAPAIRSSPLVWDFGEGPTAVFGWILDPENPAVGRISAIRLEADTVNGSEVTFTPLWTEEYDAWKSSVTLLPVATPPWIVAGYGLAAPPGGQSGSVGACVMENLFGGVIALDHTGVFKWQDDFENAAGNIRASAAVADIDGDGHLEVIMPVGCFGELRAYDGLSGNLEWAIQLGPRAQNSPSIGDIDGDGLLEIVVGSYDGSVVVLDGGLHTYLPVILR